MALVTEDGTGKHDAEAYVTVAQLDTYWTNRAHDANSTAWAALTTANKEGAAREATAYIDGQFGEKFRGVRAGQVQALEWPRVEAYDDVGYPINGVPADLITATAELAVRASSARLVSDQERGGAVKREKVEGAVEVEYFDWAKQGTEYPVVKHALARLCKKEELWGFR